MKNVKDIKVLSLAALGLFISLIVSNTISKYGYEFQGSFIMLSVYTFPFTFFFSNMITKKYGIEKTLSILFYTIVLQTVFYMFSNILGTPMDSSTLLASLTAFGISQLTNIVIYSGIAQQKTENKHFLSILFTYFLVLIIDSFVYFLAQDLAFNATLLYCTLIKFGVATVLALLQVKFFDKLSTK